MLENRGRVGQVHNVGRGRETRKLRGRVGSHYSTVDGRRLTANEQRRRMPRRTPLEVWRKSAPRGDDSQTSQLLPVPPKRLTGAETSNGNVVGERVDRNIDSLSLQNVPIWAIKGTDLQQGRLIPARLLMLSDILGPNLGHFWTRYRF